MHPVLEILSCLVALAGTLMAPRAAEPADLILAGGVVHTVDASLPRAEAVAVRGGLIVYVGATSGAMALRGPDTRVVELKGRAVVPGLTDAHGHLAGLGRSLSILDLSAASSAAAIASLVRQRAAGLAEGEWIEGRGWDQNDWEDKSFPAAAVLDAAAPRHPVALRRVDGHATWVNRRAMELAGVTRSTPDPEGGRIVRDASGEPTGVFVDTAEEMIDRLIPEPDRAARRSRLEQAIRRCLESGLTEVHDAGVSLEDLELYEELLVKGDLPFRVYAMLDADAVSEATRPLIPPRGGRLTARAVKMYADGALGSRGAALLAPYADEPGGSGLLREGRQELQARVERAARLGLQVNVHAIGDRANRLVLDAFASVLPEGGAGRRFRVEHAQVLALEDIPRFARMGVIASMQPTHATSDMPWAEARLGPERVQGAYAWRRLLDAGARLACGSDFPVESERPMLGFYAAVTRRDLSGRPEGGWLARERLTREEALRCFTLDAAHAAFEEESRGSITPGKLADLTVLSRDILSIPERDIPAVQADMTIVGGRIAHERR